MTRKLGPLIAFAMLVLGTPAAMACDDYVEISAADTKAYRDVLADTAADPLDRYFAFEQLACSSSAPIRAYATQMALQGNTDTILRSQVLLHILTSKQRIIVELSPSRQSTPADQEALKKSGGQLSLIPKFVSVEQGCVSFTSDCDPKRAMLIIGERVELGFDAANSNLQTGGNSAFGEFELTDANELVGNVRLDSYSNGHHGSVNGLIRLD